MLDKLVWGVSTLTDIARWDTRYIGEGVIPVFEKLERAKRGELSDAAYQSFKGLNHEHPFERRHLVDRMLAGDSSALTDALGWVVTRAEHRALATEAKNTPGKTGWARYHAANIRIWDRMMGAFADPKD